MMDHETEILLAIEAEEPLPQEIVSQRRTGSSKTGIWRICGALLAVALCAAAAVCFTFNKPQTHQDDGSDLRHMLRSASQKGHLKKKDAIHLTGENSEETSVEWKDNVDQAFVEGGLKLVNNEIIIPNDGIYFVYTQASFYVKCTPNLEYPDDREVEYLSHAVYRYSKSYADYKSLFSSLRSACVQVPGDSENYWYNTIYLGAAFHLHARDKLRTNTTTNNFVQIESGHGKTFFGAFAL